MLTITWVQFRGALCRPTNTSHHAGQASTQGTWHAVFCEPSTNACAKAVHHTATRSWRVASDQRAHFASLPPPRRASSSTRVGSSRQRPATSCSALILPAMRLRRAMMVARWRHRKKTSSGPCKILESQQAHSVLVNQRHHRDVQFLPF